MMRLLQAIVLSILLATTVEAWADPTTDDISLKTALTACRDRDPNAFFDAFVQSCAVQKKYSAASIEYVLLRPDSTVNSWNEVPASDYNLFPILIEDHYRKSAQPLSQGVDEHVIIELSQAQDEAFVVEWTRVTYDGKSDGGDDLGTAYTLDGQRYKKGQSATDGQLFFEATSDCWKLITDTRNHRSYAAE